MSAEYVSKKQKSTGGVPPAVGVLYYSTLWSGPTLSKQLMQHNKECRRQAITAVLADSDPDESVPPPVIIGTPLCPGFSWSVWLCFALSRKLIKAGAVICWENDFIILLCKRAFASFQFIPQRCAQRE